MALTPVRTAPLFPGALPPPGAAAAADEFAAGEGGEGSDEDTSIEGTGAEATEDHGDVVRVEALKSGAST